MITLTRNLSLGAVLVIAGCVGETGDHQEEAIANASGALERTGGTQPGTSTPSSTGLPTQTLPTQNGYSCSCIETYRGGAERVVSSCDNTNDRCADVSTLADCQEDPDGPDCDYLLKCECNCTALTQTTEFEHGPFDDIVLTGIPDLWQFDYMCDDAGGYPNAVGCGPVATAMVMYHWAQQGYEGLVEDHLIGNGSPATQDQDWQDLVRTLRADYLDGGICVPFGGGQYAATMGKMTTGIAEYIEDSGYDADVEHYKVCDSCNAGAADEILSGEALDIIKDELDAGRPLIMGMNSGRAFATFTDVSHDGAIERVYTGELSNGAPVTGIIDHYVVITGYRRIAGMDVLTLNVGWHDDFTNHQVQWNPGGKWLHLYTIDIDDAPDGAEWCSIDRGVDDNGNPPTADAFSQPYIEISHVPESTPSTENEVTALAGTSCGIAREGEYSTYYDETYELETCPTRLPDEEDLDDVVWHQSDSPVGGHEGGVGYEGGPPILDEEQPLP